MLLAANADANWPQFGVLGENDLAEYTLSSPAISEGQLFIRTPGHLYCIGQRRR